ncbi:MAG: hypothetical protein KTR29_24200 [Rhodothermaceae bacterium]|nr:hypothetical protein [Rhodothermaceae bacterium]
MIDLNEIQQMLQSPGTGGTAFQSFVITSLQMLATIHEKEVHANEAALSLGQQTKVQRMMGNVEELQRLLKSVLNKQGKQLLDMQIALTSKEPEPSSGSWWACLDELIETIGLGIECIGSIIRSQPKESLARMLGAGVIDVLSVQHKELLAETDEQLINK